MVRAEGPVEMQLKRKVGRAVVLRRPEPCPSLEALMPIFHFSRRSAFVFAAAVATGLPAAAQTPVKEIRIDYATYNPVSLLLKERGLLEKEFARDGVAVRWVLSLGSNKAL